MSVNERPSTPIRASIAKPGLDGHDRGAKVLARGLRDEGFEVDLHRAPPDAGDDRAAPREQEDVDVVGLSILSGAHMALLPRITGCFASGHGRRADRRRRHHPGRGRRPPPGGRDRRIFGPGTSIDQVARYLRANVAPGDA